MNTINMNTRTRKLLAVGRQFANVGFNYGQLAGNPTLTQPTISEYRHLLTILKDLQEQWDKAYVDVKEDVKDIDA